MKTLGQTIGAESPATSGLTLGEDGHYNSLGYPVTAQGRPDWCARCAKLEVETARSMPYWRPNRVARETVRAPDGSTRVVVLGLCADCARLERDTKARLREAAGVPLKRAGGWR